MARRARMLALLQLALLMVKLIESAPVPDDSNIIGLGSDEIFSGERADVAHAIESKSETGGSAAKKIAVSEETMDNNNDSLEEKVDHANSMKDSDSVPEENENSTPIKTKEDASRVEDSTAVSQENVDSVVKDNEDHSDAGKAEDSAAVPDESMDEATKSREDAKTVQSSEEITKNHKDHTANENEEDVSVRETSGSDSGEKVSKVIKTPDDPSMSEGSDVGSEETVDKLEGSALDTNEDTSVIDNNEKVLEENVGKHEEIMITKTVGDIDNDSNHIVQQTERAITKLDSYEEHSEETKEHETILKLGDKDEVSEENNKDTQDDHATLLQNSSEETSDVEDTAEDVEVENHSTAYVKNHDVVTSSPFAQLQAPSSDSHHVARGDEHNDKDAMEDKHQNHSPSVEETAEKEAGSPDELIENDRVDSEVINSDNKTAAMGRSMPIAEDEKDADSKEESDKTEESSEDSKEISHILPETTASKDVKNSGEHQETSPENEKEKSEDETSENKFETETKDLDKLLQVESDNVNLVDKDDEHEDGELAVDEKIGDIASSNEDGSGITPDMLGMPLLGDKDGLETSNKVTSDDTKEEKERNKEEEGVPVVSENEAKPSDNHNSGGFEDSGSGHEKESSEKHEGDGEDGPDSESHSLHALEGEKGEHTTESIANVPLFVDNGENSLEHDNVSSTPEIEISTKEAFVGQADKNENSGHHVVQNKTYVNVMSGNEDMADDGSGEDVTTTADVNDEVPANILKDITDDKEMDLGNNTAIGEASHAYQEKPVEKVISPQLAIASSLPITEIPCIADEENEDCVFDANVGVTDILEDDDEVLPEPTTDDGMKEVETIISTTPAAKIASDEETSQPPIATDLNGPLWNSNEEVASSTTTSVESIESQEDVDNEMVINNVEVSPTETGIKEMSGKMRAANVNELGISGQQNPDDLSESEALDNSNASGSYVVLGCIIAVVVVLLAYAVIKSRRERGANTSSKKQSEVAGDDDDGTELKDMKKALLPPETPHDDRNGDIEANRKPLMEKDGNQEEDVIKQNGTVELSEHSRDLESQVDSGASPNKPQQRNGLSEVVVEKPAMSNGKADCIITQPVAAKVKVIENEDSIAKVPLIITRGGNSPPH